MPKQSYWVCKKHRINFVRFLKAGASMLWPILLKGELIMPQSLLRTIHSLAKYEHFKKCFVYDENGEEYEIPPLTTFLSVWNSIALSEKACNLVLAADRLIGYLLSYREEISIGQRYFQPTFSHPRNIAVYFQWDKQNKNSFCAGCYHKDCTLSRFSSQCPRFRIAWAVEHVVGCTNRLIRLANRKEARTC